MDFLFCLKKDYYEYKPEISEVLTILERDFVVTPENYPKLKGALTFFLNKHCSSIKRRLVKEPGMKFSKYNKTIKDFEISINKRLIKYIKPEDMHEFNSFWPNVLTNRGNEDLISSVKKGFHFNITHKGIHHNFPEIDDLNLVNDVVSFIHNASEKYLFDYFTLPYPSKNKESTQFFIQFSKDIGEDSIARIFSAIIKTRLDFGNADKTILGSIEFARVEAQHAQSMEELRKEMDCMILEKIIPAKNTAASKSVKI